VQEWQSEAATIHPFPLAGEQARLHYRPICAFAKLLAVIPPFDASGVLPPGVHPATLVEIADRFGQSSELRRAQMDSVRWMIDLARRSGVRRIVLNGSFVTHIIEPNDVDCVLLIGPDFPIDLIAENELLDGLPFLELKIVGQAEFEEYVKNIFGTDRSGVPKGTIEVIP
jgi:hypothetical protein